MANPAGFALDSGQEKKAVNDRSGLAAAIATKGIG
jgi:hypothetical protein